jgi:hypothetical protein
MIDVPLPIDVRPLFVDPDMFDSPEAFREAGFDVADRGHASDSIMVGRHESAPGYLFKKFNNDRRLDEQLENYQGRIEGARRVHALIDAQHLQRIVVPRKWLYELPPAFARKRKKRLQPSHVLVVDKIQIMDKDDSRRMYADIDPQTLRDLCVVVFHFNGLDSIVKNVPFTEDRKIAFIDTESWNRHEGRKPLKYIREYLSSERWDQARDIFDELEQAAKLSDH